MMDLNEYNHVVGSTAEEFAATGLEPGLLFPWQIAKMNAMYELPVNQYASLENLGESPVSRMQGFLKTLQKEMDEGQEIMAVLKLREVCYAAETLPTEIQVIDALTEAGVDKKRQQTVVDTVAKAIEVGGATELDRQLLVMLGDWLGDMQVFNRSEAMKYGIDLESVLACIMGSNFTKLGADGLPIKDEHGKFLKGPNFRPPEEHIYATLFDADVLQEEFNEKAAEVDRLSAVALPALLGISTAIFETPEGADEEWEEGDESGILLDDDGEGEGEGDELDGDEEE